MSDVDVHHLAAAYALDALDEHERAEFEAHYGLCDVCHDDVVAFRRTLADVAAAFTVAPAPSVKSGVMAAIATTRQLSPMVPPVSSAVSVPAEPKQMGQVIPFAARRSTRVLLGVAAAVILLVGAFAVVRSEQAVDDEAAYAADLARVMEQPDARIVDLAPGDGVEGSFRVAWSSSLGEAVLIGEDLPEAGPGTAYELWWFPDPSGTNNPESPNADGRLALYVLDDAGDGNVHRSMEIPAAPAAWAITIEPEEGAAVTTGDVLFIAET